VLIRPERAGDEAAVRQVLELAFGRAVEADLVENLRRAGVLVPSLVAEDAGRVVGHIGFSPVAMGESAVRAVGLAPLAVLPERQRQGIGSRLTQAGLEECRRLGLEAVIVLGHPDYYPRFGFSRASSFGLRYENPHFSPEQIEAAFMALELVPGALTGAGGLVRLRPEFDSF
jgi:putative acetyltransferase